MIRDRSGGADVTLTIVPGATHEMRVAPADISEDERLRDRFIRHRDDPLSEYFINGVIGWIRDSWVRTETARYRSSVDRAAT